ncbi:15020_t:CDS:1, partial [Cetraspora pellucida]
NLTTMAQSSSSLLPTAQELSCIFQELVEKYKDTISFSLCKMAVLQT